MAACSGVFGFQLDLTFYDKIRPGGIYSHRENGKFAMQGEKKQISFFSISLM